MRQAVVCAAAGITSGVARTAEQHGVRDGGGSGRQADRRSFRSTLTWSLRWICRWCRARSCNENLFEERTTPCISQFEARCRTDRACTSHPISRSSCAKAVRSCSMHLTASSADAVSKSRRALCAHVAWHLTLRVNLVTKMRAKCPNSHLILLLLTLAATSSAAVSGRRQQL